MLLALPERLPHLFEALGLLGRNAAAETQEDFEGGMAGAVEELKAQRSSTVEMAALLDGEDGPDFAPADVHVHALGLDIEELASRAEVAEVAVRFQGRRAVGNNDVRFPQRVQGADQLLPARGVQLHGAVVRV